MLNLRLDYAAGFTIMLPFDMTPGNEIRVFEDEMTEVANAVGGSIAVRKMVGRTDASGCYNNYPYTAEADKMTFKDNPKDEMHFVECIDGNPSCSIVIGNPILSESIAEMPSRTNWPWNRRSNVKALNRLFGGLRIKWSFVVIFAIVVGLIVGIGNQIPALENSSINDLASTVEWWILFAVIIGVNCNGPIDAALKVGVFFTISQPLVYLVEVPAIGLQQALLYLGYWFLPIVLTYPGGILAWLMKPRSWECDILGKNGASCEPSNLMVAISNVLVVVAMALISALAVSSFYQVVTAFPAHLLTAICCTFQVVSYGLVFVGQWWRRVVSWVVAISIAGLMIFMDLSQTRTYSLQIPDGEWSVSLSNSDGIYAKAEDETLTYTFTGLTPKENTITLVNPSGETLVFDVSPDGDGNIVITQIGGSVDGTSVN